MSWTLVLQIVILEFSTTIFVSLAAGSIISDMEKGRNR